MLAPPMEGEELVGDYRAKGLTLNRHPLALQRPTLAAKRFQPAVTLETTARHSLPGPAAW